MKKNYFIIICVLGIVISLFSFQKSVNKETQAELDKRLKKFKKMKTRICNEDAMEEVMIIVDSMLIRRAQVIKTSPISKPPIPPKPSAPDVRLPDDSTPVGPIIEN